VLYVAEVSLALGGEDVADLAPEAPLDQHVAVHEGPAEPFGENVPHRGLAGAHEADEHRYHLSLPARAALTRNIGPMRNIQATIGYHTFRIGPNFQDLLQLQMPECRL
jgi:hypothetical protein